jgi:hypothetical protein
VVTAWTVAEVGGWALVIGCVWYRQPERSYAEYLWQMDLEKLHDQLAVIDYLRTGSAPQGYVYAWRTAPAINFLTTRPPATRFASNLGLISPWGLKRRPTELVHDLKQDPPRLIVVERHGAIPGVSYSKLDSEEMLQGYPCSRKLSAHSTSP